MEDASMRMGLRPRTKKALTISELTESSSPNISYTSITCNDAKSGNNKDTTQIIILKLQYRIADLLAKCEKLGNVNEKSKQIINDLMQDLKNKKAEVINLNTIIENINKVNKTF